MTIFEIIITCIGIILCSMLFVLCSFLVFGTLWWLLRVANGETTLEEDEDYD